MNQPLLVKIGLIGCGYWGPNYARVLHSMPSVKVVTCSDLDSKKLEKLKHQFPAVAVTQNYLDILADAQVDTVVVSTQATTHFEIVKKCLEADRHVLVEKPLAMEEGEGEELVNLAAKKKKILMVGHTFLYNPAVRKLKECVEKGVLGKIYYLHSTRTHLGLIRKDVNAIWDLAPHDVSIFSYLLGQNPVRVSAVGGSYLNNGMEDVAFITLHYPGGVLANIHISWVDSNKVRQVAVIGSQARVVFDDLNNLEKVRVYEKGISMDRPYNTFGEFQLLLRDGDIISPKVEPREPLRDVCEEFVNGIACGGSILSDGNNGLNVVRVMAAVAESVKQNGAPIPIKYRRAKITISQ
jgi:predicted dehydrogenase